MTGAGAGLVGGRGDRPVAVVTGGGGGIGAAIATELARRGSHVVTVDPLVTVDGSATVTEPGTTVADRLTADRIVADGGSAETAAISVTDADAVQELFDRLVRERGRVDSVVNVAGITRPTGFATGSEEDWAAVLAVHLDGYVNVLRSALPIMAAAGAGRILGVTSGSGWRAADAGAYSCAKRAVAALTWQLGAVTPPGVVVNAVSPIALTRMVTAALARAQAAAPPTASGSGEGRAPRRSTGGLSLGHLPPPESLGPLVAHLLEPGPAALSGQVLFAGGSEVAAVRSPRLMEVARVPHPDHVGGVLDAMLETWLTAEAEQRTTGGANPRFGALYGTSPEDASPATTGEGTWDTRVLVFGGGRLASLVADRLRHRGSTVVVATGVVAGVGGARDRLTESAAELGGLDAVVVTEPAPAATGDGWHAVVEDHVGLADRIAADARWTRAAADHGATTGRAIRVVTVVDAGTPGGRTRAQAAAQLSRAAPGATDGRVHAFAIASEAPDRPEATAALAALLAAEPRALGLAGAELAVGADWVGLRSHPAPVGSLVYGGPELPPWFDRALAEMVAT